MKKIQLLVILGFLHFNLTAKPVSEAEARNVAQGFLLSKGIEVNSHDLINSLTDIKIKLSLLYIFNIPEGGFIIISGDDETTPVLGYSTSGVFGTSSLPPSFAAMLSFYNEQITAIQNDYVDNSLLYAEEWLFYQTSTVSDNTAKATEVHPLLTCLWDQGNLYNALCPQDPAGPGGRVYAGCVATAMAMNMYYYRYPVQPSGTHGYTSDYGYLFVDYTQSHYIYEQMPYKLLSYNYDAAKLQYDCGVAVDMMYSPNGSGAYMDDALNALKDHFGFNPTASIEYKDSYSEATWISMLKDQLNLGYPLIYAGYDIGAGHAFVCDGYDTNDFFHFNWGWSGSYNGYYLISNLNPGYNFSSGQQAFFNCYPASVSYPQSCGNYSMNSRSGSLSVGHGPSGSYMSDMNCSWLIAPVDSVSYIELSFRYIDTETNNDIITVYGGTDASAPVLGSYSGNTIPSTLTIQGNRAFVTFQSNGSVEASGFHADYYGNVPQFCSILQILSDSSGSFNDGSYGYEYANNATCRWKIVPDMAAGIEFTFTEFNLENGMDFLYFYDYNTDALIATFTGNSIPQSLFTSTSKVMVLFRSDDSNADQGFRINYRGLQTSIQDDDFSNIILSKTSNGDAMLSFNDANHANLLVCVFDLSGREIVKKIPVEASTDQIILPISHQSPGLYFIQITSNNSSKTLRFAR